MDRTYGDLPGPIVWRLFNMDRANAPSGVVAAAFMHAVERGWARGDEDGDWREPVCGDEEDVIEVLRSRSAFKYLLNSHPEDEVEALAVASALKAVPAAWKSRASGKIERLAQSWPGVRRLWVDWVRTQRQDV